MNTQAHQSNTVFPVKYSTPCNKNTLLFLGPINMLYLEFMCWMFSLSSFKYGRTCLERALWCRATALHNLQGFLLIFMFVYGHTSLTQTTDCFSIILQNLEGIFRLGYKHRIFMKYVISFISSGYLLNCLNFFNIFFIKLKLKLKCNAF